VVVAGERELPLGERDRKLEQFGECLEGRRVVVLEEEGGDDHCDQQRDLHDDLHERHDHAHATLSDVGHELANVNGFAFGRCARVERLEWHGTAKEEQVDELLCPYSGQQRAVAERQRLVDDCEEPVHLKLGR
jgi:hypothetical protein